MISKQDWLILFAILALAVLLRIGVAFYLGDIVDAPANLTDQRSYHALGVRHLEGHGFSFGVGWHPFVRACGYRHPFRRCQQLPSGGNRLRTAGSQQGTVFAVASALWPRRRRRCKRAAPCRMNLVEVEYHHFRRLRVELPAELATVTL